MEQLECNVRNARVNDLGKVILVELQSFGEHEAYPLSLFINALSLNPELFLVIECNGIVKGYIMGLVEDNHCHLISIAVEPNSRGRGLGRKLLRSFENKCLELGLREVILEVRVDNIIALNLYKAEGYIVKERVPGYYQDGVDAYVMVKRFVSSPHRYSINTP